MTTIEEDHKGVLLEKGIDMRDLLSNGCRFQINHENVEDELFTDLIDEEYNENVDESLYQSPWDKSFAELKESMVKIPEYNIYKRIVKQGDGEILADRKSRIFCHYNGFFENEKEAFDSTYLRESQTTFITDDGTVLRGIILALQTMRKGEEAQFIIGYELMYGVMGCPPRIKPKADCLFVIQLINFVETGDENACDSLSEDDKSQFAKVIVKAEEVHRRGIDLFKHGQYSSAIRAFHSAVQALEFCKMSSDEEQKQQQDFLIRLYTNLAVCYNKKENWTKTCCMVNEIARISNVNKNCKALFSHGKALLMLKDFKQAGQMLRRAHALEPNNSAVNKELIELEKQQKTHVENERMFYQRAFGAINNAKEGSKAQTESNGDDVFKTRIIKTLTEFKNNDESKKLPLPNGLTSDEINCIEELIKDLNLELKVSNFHNGKKAYSVNKK